MNDWTLAESLGLMTAPDRREVMSYRIIIRDFVLPFSVGIHPFEKKQRQRVRINLELLVATSAFSKKDIKGVCDYDFLIAGIRKLADAGHFDLVEILADEIAALCLGDVRVESARVSVEKLDVFPEGAVGVVVEQRRARQF